MSMNPLYEKYKYEHKGLNKLNTQYLDIINNNEVINPRSLSMYVINKYILHLNKLINKLWEELDGKTTELELQSITLEITLNSLKELRKEQTCDK